MARARNIKPSFFTNEDLVEMPFETRLLFIGLWTLADRDGYLEDRPKQIKMQVFPADNVDVNNGLKQLHDAGMINRYVVDGKGYIHIINFIEHQSPHYKESPSTIPKPEASPGHDGHSSIQKPEVLPPIIEPKTRDKPEASPGQTPGKHQPRQVLAPSDSLIPDSLIPDDGGNISETTTRGGVDNSDPPTKPPGTVIYSPYPMRPDWTPSDSFDSLARSSGLVLGDDLPVAEMREFRTYWLTQPNMRRTDGEWDHAFIKHLKAQAARQSGKHPPGNPSRANVPANSLYDPSLEARTGGRHAKLQ